MIFRYVSLFICFFILCSPVKALEREDSYKEIKKAVKEIEIAEKDIKNGKEVSLHLENFHLLSEKNNDWLARELKLLEKTEKKDEKLIVLSRLKSRLHALLNVPLKEKHVNKEDIKNRIKTILSQKQFRHFDLYSLKDRFLKWLLSISFIKELLEIMNLDISNDRQKTILYIILVITSVSVSAITAFLIISLKRRFAGTVREIYKGEFLSKKRDARLWEQKAKELSGHGDYRLALQSLLFSLLLNLDRKDILLFDSAKTNREYTALLKHEKKSDMSETFESFCNIYDRKWYGLEDCSHGEYKEAFEIFKNCVGKI